QLPLHLICHDDWPRTLSAPMLASRWIDRIFGEHYRSATSRLCVSPFMSSDYQQRYGAPGQVLYPSRAANALHFLGPMEAEGLPNRPFTCSFAGTINLRGITEALSLLARSLIEVNGQLLIFGPADRTTLKSNGLEAENIVCRGLIPADRII